MINDYVGPHREVINYMIIILKQYIYAKKCFGELPKFTEYMYKLSCWYKIDKLIATENDTVNKFDKHWKNLFQ